MHTPIHDFLVNYSGKNPLRCHTPGTKGRANSPHDITEITGADSLFESSGIIRQSEENAARLFGARASFYSCGGSTLAVQAMIMAAVRASGRPRIQAGRYSHRSVVGAAVLLGLEVEWLYPGEYLSAELSPDLLLENAGAACAVVTGVDYYGGEADVRALAKASCAPLLVDNAHGAYKAFTGDHPIVLGAAMSADSAHKTLPALTGAGYLHVGDPAYLATAKAEMALFGSSSPSYLMLESLDLCNRHIAQEAGRAREAFDGVWALKNALRGAGYALRPSDKLRVTVDAAGCGYSGLALAEEMRARGIEPELADEDCVVLLFSTICGGEFFEAVEKRLCGVKIKPARPREIHPILRPEKALNPREAYFSPGETVRLSCAVGRICAEILAPCPPGVPVIMPGEVIDRECAEELRRLGVGAVRVVE